MDSGGYTNSQYWVDMDFISDGISLTEKEAKKLMVDSTGITYPAGWEVGMYMQGSENKPVTGISWYEDLLMPGIKAIYFLQCIIGLKQLLLQRK